MDRLTRRSRAVHVTSVLVLAILLSTAPGTGLTPVTQDLTTYDEYDPSNSITVNQTNVTMASLSNGQESVTKQKRAAVYNMSGSFKIHKSSTDTARVMLFTVSENRYQDDGNLGDFVGIEVNHDSPDDNQNTRITVNGSQTASQAGIPIETTTYVNVSVDTINNEVHYGYYSDKARTSPYNEGTISIGAGATYNYIAPVSGYEDTSGPKAGIDGNLTDFAVDTETLQTLSGQVFDQDSNELNNVNITVKDSGSVVAETQTDSNGRYSIGVLNGTYNVTANKDGYFAESKNVTVTGNTRENFELLEQRQALQIDVRDFLEHNQETDYKIVATLVDQQTGNTDRVDVTNDANTTFNSGNTTVLTVDTNDNTVQATADTSINTQSYVEASYTTDDGRVLNATKNVTVANETMDNFEILPPAQRFAAVIDGGTDSNPDDKTFAVLFVATIVGVAASLIATSFAGLFAMVMIVTLGWILDFVSDGVLLVAILMGMFIGLNIAANINYPTRQ